MIALFIKCADRRRVGGTHLKRLQHFRNEVVYFLSFMCRVYFPAQLGMEVFTLNGLPGKSRVHDRLPLYPPVPTDRSMPPFTVCGLGDIVVLILQSFQAVILIRQSF